MAPWADQSSCGARSSDAAFPSCKRFAMNDLFGIQGLHVLVTGGSSGLGRFFATFLAARGARVTVGARRAEALAKTVDDISAAKGQAQSVVMDVTVAASIETALDAAEARFGPVQIVINNAGVTATRPALQQDEADWDKVVDTNLKGVWLVAQASAPHGRAQGEGLDRQCGVDPGPAGRKFGRSLCDFDGRCCTDDQGAGPGMGALRYPRQRACPGIFRNRTERRFLPGGRGPGADQANSTAAAWRIARARRPPSAARFGSGLLHDRERDRR